MHTVKKTYVRSLLIAIILVVCIFSNTSCDSRSNPNKAIPVFLLKFAPNSFSCPVGENDFATEKRDWSDEWYNAQDFGDNNHLGEDWNKNTGGDTDCGEPVYATANGNIIFGGDAGTGWGNVLIVEHTAEDGTAVQSLYGHLETLTKTQGKVTRREPIGTVGSANGRYPCHLHFEIRWNVCPLWNKEGPGYSDDRIGWIDPSEFIQKQRDPARYW
jgi:murein DD-endopeptidase MepM/ murein hydrolase activator NlpD